MAVVDGVFVAPLANEVGEEAVQAAKELLDKLNCDFVACEAGLDLNHIAVVDERFEQDSHERYAVGETHVKQEDDDRALFDGGTRLLLLVLVLRFVQDKVGLEVDFPQGFLCVELVVSDQV